MSVYTVLSKEQSILGTDWYRNGSIAVPNAWKPTIQHKVASNADGSNHNVTIRSDDYVVVDNVGSQSQTDRFILTTKFNSLQSVTAATERARIYDNHVAYLIATRDANLAGNLPDNAVTKLPDMTAVYAVPKV